MATRDACSGTQYRPTISKAVRAFVQQLAGLALFSLPLLTGCSLQNEEFDVTDDPKFQPPPPLSRASWIHSGDQFVVTEPLFIFTGRHMPTNVNDKRTPVLLPPGAERFDLYGPTPKEPIVPLSVAEFERARGEWPNVLGVLPTGTRLQATRVIRCVNRSLALQSFYLYLKVLNSSDPDTARLNADLYWPGGRFLKIGIERLGEAPVSR